MRIGTRRKRWTIVLSCFAGIACLFGAAFVALHRYIITPRPIRAYTSPDGRYRCVVVESPWDEFGPGTSCRLTVEDASGRMLIGGDLGETYVADVLWYDDMFVARSADPHPVVGICHHGRIYSESDLATITSDKDLAELADCKNLHHLTLRGPGVTDEGLMRLRYSGGLVTLCVDRAAVSMNGLRSLHRALPTLRIFGDVASTQPVSFDG